MANSPILFLLIIGFWVLGIIIVWFILLFVKPKNVFVLKKTRIPIHFLCSFVTFVIIGAIIYMFAFIFAPDQSKDCIGPVCKVVKTNKLELSRNLGIVFGLLSELGTSLSLSLKFFTKN